jgi:acyl carrier protein
MEKRIKKIMSDIFDVEISQINERSTPDNIENWDSFNQINLVMSLEEEFNVTLSDDDILEMISFPLIKIIIENALSSEI